MARRYSGVAVAYVIYTDHDEYVCSVVAGTARESMKIRPAAAGFGPGVAYDSPEAYDQIARTAFGFAANDNSAISDRIDYHNVDIISVKRSR